MRWATAAALCALAGLMLSGCGNVDPGPPPVPTPAPAPEDVSETWVRFLKAFPEKDASSIIPLFNPQRWFVEMVTRKRTLQRDWSGQPAWPTRANLNEMMFFGDECGGAKADNALELVEPDEGPSMLRHGFAVWVCNRTYDGGEWELRFQAQTLLFDPTSSGIFYAHTFECRGPPQGFAYGRDFAELEGAQTGVAQVGAMDSDSDPSSVAMADLMAAWQGASRSNFVRVFAEDAKFVLFDSVADKLSTHLDPAQFGEAWDSFFVAQVCEADAHLRMSTVGTFAEGTIGVGELRAGGLYRGHNLLVTVVARRPPQWQPGQYEITRLYAMWTETFFDRLMAEALI